MRFWMFAAASAFAAAAAPAQASTVFLSASAGAGACGGDISCFFSSSQTVSPAVSSSVASASQHSTRLDGSFADSSAVATVGALHVFADAFRDTGVLGDAQAGATVEFFDTTAPGMIVGNNFNFTFQLLGSHTPIAGDYALSADARLQYTIVDTTTHSVLAYGSRFTTDAAPTFTINQSVFVPTGDAISLDVTLLAEAYALNYGYGPNVVNGELPVTVDYSHTLKVFAAATSPGGAIGFLSGHDYAPPPVPEPSTWALMIAGVGLCGVALRRRQQAVPA